MSVYVEPFRLRGHTRPNDTAGRGGNRVAIWTTRAALALLLFAVPASAQADSLQWPYAGWLAHSHAPRPPAALTVREEPCPGGYGVACAWPDGTTIYLDASARDPSSFLHEVGHAFDFQVMTDSTRTRFAAIFGRTYDAVNYRALAGHDGSLAEWFAEGYRLCAMFPRLRHVGSVDQLAYLYQPTPREHRHVCALLRYVAAQNAN